MNRTQRRQAERNARRGISYAERVIPLPPLVDEFTIFDIPQSILTQISHGAIDSMQGVPVFRDNTGEWCEVTPALAGWIFTWEKLNAELELRLDLSPLNIICKRLQSFTPITRENIGNALLCLDACRMAFRTNDRQRIAYISKNAQIQLYLE